MSRWSLLNKLQRLLSETLLVGVRASMASVMPSMECRRAVWANFGPSRTVRK